MPLYYRGNIDLLAHKYHLSVIGSRAVTHANERNLRHVLDPISNPGLCIVSGLALGMDALSHELALANGLPTIAILGSSVDDAEIYPRSNVGLARRILEHNGLLLSPFQPQTDIMPYNFPIRNQIIAALSTAILVASAAKKSGALITARLALDYGHDVLVIPGNPSDPLYEGSNLLLQQGATPVLNAGDILDYFGLAHAAQTTHTSDDPLEREVLGLLRTQGYTAHALSIAIKAPQSTINSLLTKFELRSWITRTPDGMIHLR